MKKTLKIISVIFLILILNFALLVNTVQAVENGQATIFPNGEFKRVIRKNGIVIKTTNAVYEINGKTYPAYCLNRELDGVGEVGAYNVTNTEKITDTQLWRVITNGYPYKSLEQLGVADEDEAYIATKQAIYCYLENTDIAVYSGIGEAGNRVLNAMKQILENAKNSTATYENNVEIVQDEKWQVENNYISRQYELKCNINILKFTVNLENAPKGCKITNLEGQEKSEFNSEEKFKISIPITSLGNDGQFKIKIQTQMESKPVFYGKSPSVDLQNYALTAYSYEDINTELVQNYDKNTTKVIIEKQDKETQEKLKGAEFEILDLNKKVIKKAETNNNGQIVLEQIMPGTYYIREVKAPEGYDADGQVQKIKIKLNEKQTIKIENSKIPEEPPAIEEPKIEELPVIEEPPVIEEIPVIEKLPVTGM